MSSRLIEAKTVVVVVVAAVAAEDLVDKHCSSLSERVR
jgi:hypothetical protein